MYSSSRGIAISYFPAFALLSWFVLIRLNIHQSLSKGVA